MYACVIICDYVVYEFECASLIIFLHLCAGDTLLIVKPRSHCVDVARAHPDEPWCTGTHFIKK